MSKSSHKAAVLVQPAALPFLLSPGINPEPDIFITWPLLSLSLRQSHKMPPGYFAFLLNSRMSTYPPLSLKSSCKNRPWFIKLLRPLNTKAILVSLSMLCGVLRCSVVLCGIVQDNISLTTRMKLGYTNYTNVFVPLRCCLLPEAFSLFSYHSNYILKMLFRNCILFHVVSRLNNFFHHATTPLLSTVFRGSFFCSSSCRNRVCISFIFSSSSLSLASSCRPSRQSVQ